MKQISLRVCILLVGVFLFFSCDFSALLGTNNDELVTGPFYEQDEQGRHVVSYLLHNREYNYSMVLKAFPENQQVAVFRLKFFRLSGFENQEVTLTEFVGGTAEIQDLRVTPADYLESALPSHYGMGISEYGETGPVIEDSFLVRFSSEAFVPTSESLWPRIFDFFRQDASNAIDVSIKLRPDCQEEGCSYRVRVLREDFQRLLSYFEEIFPLGLIFPTL